MIETDIANSTHDTNEMIEDEVDEEGDLEGMSSKNKDMANLPNVELTCQNESEDLYTANTDGIISPTNGILSSSTTTRGVTEGFDKFERIEDMLKTVEPDEYMQYLNNFKREKVDVVRLENYRTEFARDHEIWRMLIPAYGTRKDFLDILYSEV